MRKLLATTALIGLAGALAAPGFAAADVIWTFNTPSGDQGLSQTYQSNPLLSPPQNIVATAFTPSTNSGDLYGKNGGKGETGLGLTNNGDNEITPGSYIQLDITGLSVPPLGGITMSFQAGSTTDGEEWAVYGTATPGTPGSGVIPTGATLLDSGFNNKLDPNIGSVIGIFNYLDVTELAPGSSNNILLAEVDAPSPDPVPEPASLVLLGVGVLGTLVFARRRAQ